MLGATLVCAVGSSRYRAHENGQRPFSVVFLNDFRVALRMQIARPQAAKVSKILFFDTFVQTGNKSPDSVRAFLTV